MTGQMRYFIVSSLFCKVGACIESTYASHSTIRRRFSLGMPSAFLSIVKDSKFALHWSKQPCRSVLHIQYN